MEKQTLDMLINAIKVFQLILTSLFNDLQIQLASVNFKVLMARCFIV